MIRGIQLVSLHLRIYFHLSGNSINYEQKALLVVGYNITDELNRNNTASIYLGWIDYSHLPTPKTIDDESDIDM